MTTDRYAGLVASSLVSYSDHEWGDQDDDDEECAAIPYQKLVSLISHSQNQEDPETSIWNLPVTNYDHRRACYDEIARAINGTTNERERGVALENLTFIWNRLDELTTNTEAKFRLRLEPQKLHAPTASPEWLKCQLDELQKDGVDRHLRAVTEWLIVSVLNALDNPSDLTATINKLPSGRVEVEWEGRAELRWLITPAMLPFPGVNLRAFVMADVNSLVLHAETFRLASKVVDHAKKVLG